MLACFELTDSRRLGITTDNESARYLMTCERQSTLEVAGIELPALRNHIPCMAHVIQVALDAFMSSLGVKGRPKSWEAHECAPWFGENEGIDIGTSQSRQQEGNARINNVSAMRPGLAKIIEKICISWYFESSESDLHMAETGCGNDYADTGSSKRAHLLWQIHSPHRGTSDYAYEQTLELNTGVPWGAYQLLEFRRKWLQNPKYHDYRPLFLTQDEWTIVKYITEVKGPLRYWTLRMSKKHTVTLHHVITVYNDMFDHMDGMMRALAKKMTQWKENLFFAVKFAGQKLFK